VLYCYSLVLRLLLLGCCYSYGSRRRLCSAGLTEGGLPTPSSYSIPSDAPYSFRHEYVARLSTHDHSSIQSSCQFQAWLHCTPGDPMSLPPFVLFRVPRAPSQLRRPLRVPSFAPTVLPEPRTRTVATDSIRFPLQFLFSWPSPQPRTGPPTPVRHLSPNPPPFTPPTQPAAQRSLSQSQDVFVVCTSLHEPGAGSS